MKQKYLLAWALLCLCLLPWAMEAAAAEVEFYLEPVIVTAARYEKGELTPGYYKFDEQQLAAGNYDNALDVVQELPGITIMGQGASGGRNVYSNILLNGSDRYIVVIDGIRANWNGNDYNDFDFSVLPAEMLASVEVLPASAGAVYGNAAKGGVIKITTKKAAARVKTSIDLETGSYGRERENILQLGKKGDWSWSVYAQKSIMGDYSSARHSIPSYDNTEKADVKVTKSWGDAADLTLSYSAFSGRYKSSIFTDKNIGTKEDPVYVKNIFMVAGRKTENNFSLEYNRKISDNENNVLGIYRRGSNAAWDEGANVPIPWLIEVRTQGFFDRYTRQWHPKNTLTGGVEYYQDLVLDYQDNNGRYKDRSMISKAVYLQNEWQLDDRFKATGSLRQDWNSSAGNKLSPAVAVEYNPSDKLLYTLAYTEYFVPPKQVQIFSPQYGDEALLPEEGKVYEFGVAYMSEASLTLKANIFHRDAANVIAVDSVVSPVRYANIAHEKATGFTLSADKRFSEQWRAAVAYTQTKVETERSKNLRPVSTMIPHGELQFNLLYDKEPYSALLQGRGVFDQANGRGENLFANNTYWVWNASLNYKLNKQAKLYVKVNNIFNQFYSSWDKMTKVLDFDEWYAEPGRNYQIGINYTF
ncbi:TonB-dependent receptor plug domain-containing protein [Phascolarctobacterium sp.]